MDDWTCHQWTTAFVTGIGFCGVLEGDRTAVKRLDKSGYRG